MYFTYKRKWVMSLIIGVLIAVVLMIGSFSFVHRLILSTIFFLFGLWALTKCYYVARNEVSFRVLFIPLFSVDIHDIDYINRIKVIKTDIAVTIAIGKHDKEYSFELVLNNGNVIKIGDQHYSNASNYTLGMYLCKTYRIPLKDKVVYNTQDRL